MIPDQRRYADRPMAPLPAANVDRFSRKALMSRRVRA
jgi:hypothetical protein